MDHQLATSTRKLIHYDGVKRRLWIAGQRCHHGATGALLTGVAVSGLAATRLGRSALIALGATGSLLMFHDRHDRSIWFERGWQTQP